MKLLLCTFLLVTISFPGIFCGPNDFYNEIVANTAVKQIIEGGVKKGILPGGPYYLNKIIKSSVGPKETSVTVDIRSLNNQTRVTVRTSVYNEDYTMKTWGYNYVLLNGSKALTAGWSFYWLKYAASSDSQFCSPEPRYYQCGSNEDGVLYPLDDKSVAFTSPIKAAYDFLWGQVNGELKEFIGPLDPAVPPKQPMLEVHGDSYCVFQQVGQEPSDGGLIYSSTVFSVYKPCTDHRYTFYQSSSVL